MLHIFICPDCGAEHSEPAEAHFLLAVLCSDCGLVAELEIHRAGVAGREIPAAA